MRARWKKRALLALGPGLVWVVAADDERGADVGIASAERELRGNGEEPRVLESPAAASTTRLSAELASLERETVSPLTRPRDPAVRPLARPGIPIARLDRAHELALEVTELGGSEARPESKPTDDLSVFATTRASVPLGDSGSSVAVRGPSVVATEPRVISGAVSEGALDHPHRVRMHLRDTAGVWRAFDARITLVAPGGGDPGELIAVLRQVQE